MRRTSVKGFTLVELSIVLVLLALLTGGVLAGQALVRAAELRAVSTDSSRYLAALQEFKNKYDALPGDMEDAIRYWGAETGDPNAVGVDNDCADSQNDVPGTLTCNGDGSGYIADAILPADVRVQWYEAYRAWQHLSNAGLIAGTYAGTSISDGRDGMESYPGLNIPKSNIGKGSGWTFRAQVTADWFNEGFWMPSANLMILGNNTNSQEGYGPVLTPEEAWSIDKKLDDGKPGLGSIKTWAGTGAMNPDCTVDASEGTDYKLDNQAVACSFIFITKKR